MGLTEKPRVALSIRYFPSDMLFTGQYLWITEMSHHPWKCEPLGYSAVNPVVYPPSAVARQKHVWPVRKRNIDDINFAWMFIWGLQLLSDTTLRCGQKLK